MPDMNETTILLALDEESLREILVEVVREEGFNVIACRTGSDALKILREQEIHALIADLRIPGCTSLEFIDHARKRAPEAVLMLITAFGEVEAGFKAMKRGVQDYICIPLILDEVVFRLKRLLAHSDLRRENRALKEQIRWTREATSFIGESPEIEDIKHTITRVANTMSGVLISGESGTGKEVVARAIHYSGITADKPFIAVNCGALAESLVESELFGSGNGTFTGADRDRLGYFEAADGGTLFLDEIGNLPFASQAVLLRAIEQRAIERVGEHKRRRVHIRIIAATNRDLAKAVEKGTFREDLFYRLNVIQIKIPPLRERRNDIRLLIDHFVQKYNVELNIDCPGLTDACYRVLMESPWRGNVRELENVIEQAMIFAGGERIDIEDPSLAPTANRHTEPIRANLRLAVQAFEREHLRKVVAMTRGNKVEAAQRLGIGLSSLYRKLDELDVSPKTNTKAMVRSA